MKRVLIEGAFIGALVFGGCRSTGVPVASASVNGEFYIADSQRIEFENSARKGDAKAAIRLANYYLFIAGDRPRAINWLMESARLGDVSAKYNLGILLLQQNSSKSKEEGLMWIKEAAAQGDANARAVLSRRLN